MCRTTHPLPRRGDETTVAPTSRARSAVLSVELLSKTKIRLCGNTERNSVTTVWIEASSFNAGIKTATFSYVKLCVILLQRFPARDLRMVHVLFVVSHV